MALSPEMFQQLVNHLNSKIKTRKCVLCGAESWALEGHVTLPIGDVPGLMTVGGPTLANAAMVCQNCGNTHIINLVVAGLVKNG